MTRTRTLVAVLALALPCAAAWAEACEGFKWDTSREQAVFAQPASPVKAAPQAAEAPLVQLEKLYEVALAPQEEVRFAAEPSKKSITDGASAGLLRVRVDKAGTYRIAVGHAFWIDVVADGKVLPSLDFSGSHNCKSPRKIVVYELPADRELTVQLSGQVDASVQLSVTAVGGKS